MTMLREHDTYYAAGQKRNWRRRCWNEIAKRVPNKKDALVLYLSASDDSDRPVAVSKGFNPNNLLAVDIDMAVVKKIRAEGKVAIHGNLMDILAAWPHDRPVGVVFADMMSGFSQEVMTMLGALMYSPAFKDNTVVAFNLLRGREGAGAMELIAEQKLRSPDISKHRGQILYSALFEELTDHYARGKGFREGEAISPELAGSVLEYMNQRANPYFTSYRSLAGKQRFDTVIYNNFWPGLPHSTAKVWRDSIMDTHPRLVTTKKNISAALAIQRMRKNGQLASAPRN
jgi:hypothetical protein